MVGVAYDVAGGQGRRGTGKKGVGRGAAGRRKGHKHGDRTDKGHIGPNAEYAEA